MIVLVCSLFFFLSMILGTSRGVLVRYLRRRRLNRRVDRQHLLRAMYEVIEPQQRGESYNSKATVSIDQLLPMRSWTHGRLAACDSFGRR